MNFLNQLEFSLSGNFNSNDVLGKVKMFDQIASMTEEAKQEAIKKRMDYERRRSVFEKRKISSSSSTMQSTLLVLVNFCPVLSELLTLNEVLFTKTFDILCKNYQWKANLGLTFIHSSLKPLQLHDWFKKNFHFWWNNGTLDQQYLNTGLNKDVFKTCMGR